MNELAISKNNQSFATQVDESLEKSREISETITALSFITIKNNATLSALFSEQKKQLKYQLGCTLGLLKAYIDTLPPKLAEKQKLNGISMNLLIKLKVDEEVLNQREHAPNFTFETDYWRCYRRLSELICGYGYNMYFNQDRFEEFYPDGMHLFVSGFAGGYSCGFHTIAADSGIETTTTQTVKQDIWKNWPYFLKHDVTEYRLDGKYLYMYHGGINCSGDPDIPYGNNVHFVNSDVYEKLQSRQEGDFVTHTFDFPF